MAQVSCWPWAWEAFLPSRRWSVLRAQTLAAARTPALAQEAMSERAALLLQQMVGVIANA